MDRELPIRVTVIEPPLGVTFAMQRGKDELLPPSKVGTRSLAFDLSIQVSKRKAGGAPNVLGPYAQGRSDDRFLYLNSGTMAGAIAVMMLLPASAIGATSVCYGTPSHGRLEGGVQLAKSGPNFEPYSSLGVAAGRTYVHSKVANVVAEAYTALARSEPEVKYVYGESGWKDGGRIKPHRTHQNGLAVDFMVPVRGPRGTSVSLPSGIWNKFGYGIEFDSKGRFEELAIDFEAIAEHLYALHSAAKVKGVGLERVIFDPAYLPKLYETRRGDFIKRNISFMKGQAWIRHDEHYHVDFAVPCKPKKG